jgi:class 3 adenylate cyclase
MRHSRSNTPAEHIPGAHLVELDGADHWPFVGDIDAIVGEVEEFVTGSRQARPADRVLATVVFTDIVGSTERAAAIGDAAWHELLARHDAVIRDQLSRHGGREVKHTGDGFLATFDGPARAVRCAAEIAAGISKLGIEIRSGVHTGECERSNGDMGGLAVHIGARVCALAGPGEVLVSRTVHDLVLGSEIGLVDRGVHPLKGVPGKWQLFAVSSIAGALPLADAGIPQLSPSDRAWVALGRRVPAIGRAINRIVRRRRGSIGGRAEPL